MRETRFTLPLIACLVICSFSIVMAEPANWLDVDSNEVLVVPPLHNGKPAAGRRVKVTSTEYTGTDVFHTIWLPPHWKADGNPLPIVFEYTGNFFPASGSTGKVEDASLGYGLCGGMFIWVSLPYIREDHSGNEVKWWGDESATVDYAKANVPRIIEQFNANRTAVILCGFSRGAIGVNFIGLYDDETSRLWNAFFTHDHFDGVREWRGTAWGSPLNAYRATAVERLHRLGDRPYLVSQHGSVRSTKDFIENTLGKSHNIHFNEIDAEKILGRFPNKVARSSHTDRWLAGPES